MKAISWVVLVLAGFVAGVAFVAACGNDGGGPRLGLGARTAAAQSNCAQYEVQQFEPREVAPSYYAGGVTVPVPAGWTPIASGDGILIARCAQ